LQSHPVKPGEPLSSNLPFAPTGFCNRLIQRERRFIELLSKPNRGLERGSVLEGEKTYAWTGTFTNPGNVNEYEMVEDDENKTVTCTVTIGDESKTVSATVAPMYANLNHRNENGGYVVENRSTSKSDNELLSKPRLGFERSLRRKPQFLVT
jgi:hypothetical protein